MPKIAGLRRVMVIGSGPIVIGQAAEFDYAGTQACKALREEGLEVVLVNSNPATIMTDPDVADAVYLDPLTPHFLTRIIEKERPDGLLPTLGGQTGLNMAVALASAGVLKRCGVRLLGTPEVIERAEDRAFQEDDATDRPAGSRARSRRTWPALTSHARSVFLSSCGLLSLWADPAAVSRNERRAARHRMGIKGSPIHQVLERSVAGWKEIEFEVVRDAATGPSSCVRWRTSIRSASTRAIPSWWRQPKP